MADQRRTSRVAVVQPGYRPCCRTTVRQQERKQEVKNAEDSWLVAFREGCNDAQLKNGNGVRTGSLVDVATVSANGIRLVKEQRAVGESFGAYIHLHALMALYPCIIHNSEAAIVIRRNAKDRLSGYRW